jgi:hypothetical protein
VDSLALRASSVYAMLLVTSLAGSAGTPKSKISRQVYNGHRNVVVAVGPLFTGYEEDLLPSLLITSKKTLSM